MRLLVACWKLMRATIHAVGGWWTIRFVFPRLSPDQRQVRVQDWSQRMLTLLGIELAVEGTPPTHGPVLVVCNHLSWLDILAIHSARHVRFVAKSGVGSWPLIGALANGGGTLYFDNGRRRDAQRVVHRMVDALAKGDLLAIFPEGTTSDGRGLLPFHANLLQAAIASGAPVQPVGLRFADAASGETSFAPRYVDDDSLLDSVWRTLRAPPLVAVLNFGEAQPSQGRERRAWAHALHANVQALRNQPWVK